MKERHKAGEGERSVAQFLTPSPRL
uniref:Uncharacterized protein n=1 Tax=Anguilla anguilla TaxID=7936 RepID=A0A0E9SA35_ANGAN